MIIHENRLLADDSNEILYLIVLENQGIMLQNLSSAAVVIGALRVNYKTRARLRYCAGSPESSLIT